MIFSRLKSILLLLGLGFMNSYIIKKLDFSQNNEHYRLRKSPNHKIKKHFASTCHKQLEVIAKMNEK